MASILYALAIFAVFLIIYWEVQSEKSGNDNGVGGLFAMRKHKGADEESSQSRDGQK